MVQALTSRLRQYGAFAAIVPKQVLAYGLWVWTSLFTGLVALVVLVYFWRAIFAGRTDVGGLTLDQALSYALLAQILSSGNTSVISRFGRLLYRGEMAIVLLRPVDFQASVYVESLTDLGCDLLLRLPLILIGVLAFGVPLPSDPWQWAASALTLLLGYSVLFCFDWLLGCASFYTTEIWGLSVLRHSVAGFLSGALVPLALLPGWAEPVVSALPFAQALYVPLALLTGITPLANAPQIWLSQLVWLAVLLMLSRLAFGRAVRRVTVQGG